MTFQHALMILGSLFLVTGGVLLGMAFVMASHRRTGFARIEPLYAEDDGLSRAA